MRLDLTGFALVLAAVLACAPREARAHGSEYVYARLVLGARPRLEISLEYQDNPIVDSPEQARLILERDLLLGFGGRVSDLAGLGPRAVWSEVKVFPRSAPVPVPAPGDGIDHRLLTVSIDVACPFQLSLKAGSEQAVIYWVDEPGPERPETPSRWKILLAGDTSPVVDAP